MIEQFKENLLDIRKNLEKQLISSFIASQSHTKSENRKSMLKHTKKEKVTELKTSSTTYTKNFSTSAKGQWVKATKQNFDKASKYVDTL